MAAEATTAMTIDFLRARLLSERSVSRAAKDRADQLASRVAELEEQLWTVTTQRRKAERAAAEVLDILESQGFSRLSDPDGSDSDDNTAGPGAGNIGKASGEADDALSGSELVGTAAPPLPGRLSWKGRVSSPHTEKRWQLHHKGRHLGQRHSHSRRASYFYLLTADSPPNYQPGQSCRKIKRKEFRLQAEGKDDKDNGTESLGADQERTDYTICMDEQHDLDGEVSQDGQSSCADGKVKEDNDMYPMEYEKYGEMAMVLEKQAELIVQYEAEENAQREWEMKFSGQQDSTADVDLDDKLNQNEKACDQWSKAAQIMDGVVCEEDRSSYKNLFSIKSRCLLNGSAPGLSTNAPEVSAIGSFKESDHGFGHNTAAVASLDSEMHVRKDEFVNKCYSEVIEGSGNYLGRSAPFPETKYNISSDAGDSKSQGGGYSDSGSSYHANAYSSEHYTNTTSAGSPLSGTPKSEVSQWSSSCFHNNTDNQIDTQLYQPPSDDVGGVLEALRRAKMAIKEKLSRPSPPSQDMLALPAPGDNHTENYFPVNGRELALCMSRQISQDILALPASGDYHSTINFPRDDAKVPVGPAGLFRLPTDLFPQNEVRSSDEYGSRFNLVAPSRQTIFSSNLPNHIMSTPSHSHYASRFSTESIL